MSEYNYPYYPIPHPHQQGWQCPICGRIMSPTTPHCPCEGQGRKTNTSTTGATNQWKYNPTTTCGDGRSVVKQTFELGEYYSWDDYELDQVIDDTTGKILFAIIVREDNSACQRTEENNLKM